MSKRDRGEEARLAVWVMYWHMYVIVAICRESERPREKQKEEKKVGVAADGEREAMVEGGCGRGARYEDRKRQREKEQEWQEKAGKRERERKFRIVERGCLASQSRLNAQCITGLRRRRISPSNSTEGAGPTADRVACTGSQLSKLSPPKSLTLARVIEGGVCM